jgi:hypothetical protein
LVRLIPEQYWRRAVERELTVEFGEQPAVERAA